MYKASLFGLVCGVLIWSGISPADRLTWMMEAAPVICLLPLLLYTWKKFPLTELVFALMAFHAVILLIGAKFTYAEMPLFNWFKEVFLLSRNHYDRLGHLVQGLVPALLLRELLLRTSPLRPGRWLFVIIIFFCLGFSAVYELVEWQAAILLGSNADAFLATQGDPWDTQKDMALAGLGAILGQWLFSRAHDRELAALKKEA